MSKGICLISVPKSGTMFLSRYLERLIGEPVIFGLEDQTESSLLADIEDGWHPEIHAVLDTRSPDLETMSKRFAQMLSRNRRADSSGDRMRIFSDHGYSNFLQFLINPSTSQIQNPYDIVEWALERNLAPVFLYRDIRAVANSLVHFLASKKSFLVDVRSIEEAATLVTRLHAPVLAEQIQTWRRLKDDPNVLSVSYEELIADPESWIQSICKHGNISCHTDGLAEAPDNYRSWTFRGSKASWKDTFTVEQQVLLNSLLPVVAPLA